VSAAAVIPAPRVVGMIIGSKAFVAGRKSSPLNPTIQSLGCGEYFLAWGRGRSAVVPG
jgi:hypothetical protein